MLFAISGFDAPDALTAIDYGNKLCPGEIDFRKGCSLRVRLIDKRAVLVRKILLASIELEFSVRAEMGQFFHANLYFDHAGVKVLDENAVVLVILGQQPERIGLDPQIDVFADQDGLALRLGFLDVERERQDPVIN